MVLSDYVRGKDNNFNLIRMMAAFIVLLTHCYALTGGGREFEPLLDVLGMTLGSIAVDVFFITSGFLIVASLLRKNNLVDFFWARVLRIYPALLLVLVMSVFILGAFATTLPLGEYFSDQQTYAYLVTNFFLLSGVEFNLPGVFNENPYPNVVNGSLWTIPFELIMYLCLPLAWSLAGALFWLSHATGVYRRSLVGKEGVFRWLVLAYVLLTGIYVLLCDLRDVDAERIIRLSFMFFSGVAFYLLRKHIVMSPTLFWSFLSALSIAVLDEHVFLVVYVCTIAYLLFYLAYVPAGLIRRYNALGDYSYGLYIYAFPVQQTLVMLYPGISVGVLLLSSGFISLLFAVLSWHLLEKYALKQKSVFAGRTKVWLQAVS